MKSKHLLWGTGLLMALLSCSEPPEPETVTEALPPRPEVVLPLPPAGAVVKDLSGKDSLLAAIPPDTIPVPPVLPATPLPGATSDFSSRDDLISFARQYMGTPYVYAKSDPKEGFDCSGFINYVYRHYGFEVPRSSIDFRNFGREVPLAEARRGDLLLFTGAQDTDRIGHIGIVIKAAGPESEFIHASSGKEMAVTVSSLAAPHYKKRFVKVVDVITR